MPRRSLLLPRPDPAKRTPLWLQRLRAKDLLQIARQIPDFPIVLETVRECLDDDLDVPATACACWRRFNRARFASQTRRGEIPSPFTSELIFEFTAAHLYEWDEPKRSDLQPAGSIASELMLEPLLRGDVPRQTGSIRKPWAGWKTACGITGMPPRTVEEMAERLRLLGDMTPSEICGPMAAFLAELEEAGRAVRIELPGTHEPQRWILAEEASQYRAAFPERSSGDHGGAGGDRAPVPADSCPGRAGRSECAVPDRVGRGGRAAGALVRARQGRADRRAPMPRAESRWAERANLTEMRRATVAVRRRESIAVLPEVFADFLLRRQHVHPATRVRGAGAVEAVLEQLQGYAAPALLWESELLPRRIKDYRPAWLDEVLARGTWFWRAEGAGREETRVAFFSREFPGPFAACGPGGRAAGSREPDSRFAGPARGEFHGRPGQALGPRAVAGAGSAAGFDASRAGDERPVRPGPRAAPTRRCRRFPSARACTRASFSIRPRASRAIAAVPEGRWWRLRNATSRARRPRLFGGRRCFWTATACSRARSWRSSRRRPRGHSSRRCFRARNGAGRYAGATSSKGFRACSMHRSRRRPSSLGRPRSLEGRGRLGAGRKQRILLTQSGTRRAVPCRRHA